MQYRRKRRYLGAGLLCFGFMFWGLFVAMYPIFERLSDYMSTAFFVASVLQMFIAVNMIILVLEQLRHLREKRAEQQLRCTENQNAMLQTQVFLTEERYRHLFEQSSEAIVITTREDLRIVGLNGAATLILGMSEEEAHQHCLTHWFPKETLGTGPSGGRTWFETICRQRFQQLRRKDGSMVSLEVAGSAIDFAGATAFQFYLRELTERSRLEQQLRRAEKLSALGQMISGVVHELNNPLTVSGALVELVLMDKTLSTAARNHLKTASSEHQRAARMLRNFLNLAREGGPGKEAINLNELVRNVVELRRADFMKANVTLELMLDSELPCLLASADQIQQILIILINNSLQAMDGLAEAQTLRVSTRQLSSHVALTVEDSGPGVPAQLREKIFEPFFTTKPAGIGTGLGLSVAHTYVMEHQGRISYEQSKLGGACFTVELSTLLKMECEPAPAVPERVREPVLT
jgi:two-component system NtrC family sensor kinase